MKWLSLYPGEHIYSGLIRYRIRMGQGVMSDKRFFAHNHLPYHWFRSQVPLNHLMRETLDSIAPKSDEQFDLRLNHTPFAPWLLSLPDGKSSPQHRRKPVSGGSALEVLSELHTGAKSQMGGELLACRSSITWGTCLR